MTKPTPRPQIYNLYWYYAAERQAIFNRRASGQPAPWTDDPILQTFKFCNVFRASDRVSQYLIRNIAYSEPESNPRDMLFRVLAFRFFSRPDTWDAIIDYLERQPVIDDLVDESFERALSHAKTINGKLYTGAFVLCASQAYGYGDKHLNHVALFRHMFVLDDLASQLLNANNLEEVYQLLRSYPLIGDFMAYQLAIDLNYTPEINFDENSFTKAGPGAVRGIKKAFKSIGDYSPEQVIMLMVEKQDEKFKRLGLKFEGLNGRRLHAIDCQGLFCELDKYCREAVPELISNRSRIKAKHQPNAKPIDYYYPPKWSLNSPGRR
ncbi:MAG: nucleotide kinase domain-containing protein [Candidatus Saccharimonadales bacterium]